MPSTYSNLKIQLMATGENSTTWGDVTNLNLGTALEEAIVGSADVTFASNNITLVLTDTNLTQTARNVHLRCTGTTGGATRNLVVPSIEKPYIIQNDCADSIVVKTAAGTGITVPAGKTMWVYNNGVNVVDAVSHLTSLTLGAPLAVAQGGTGATDAATARTNLGITLSSGTVTSVSGAGTVNGLTLTGTVTTSGSLTLGGTLSGVSLTSAVTGTLPVSNGGTGSATAGGALTNLGAYAASNPSGFTSNAGTVTSVGGTGSVNGLSLSGTVTSSGNITLGGSVTSVDASATVNGQIIGYRKIPVSSTSGTADTNDVGKCIVASANITIPNATFSPGDAVSIYNDSASPITIVQGASATLRLAGTTTTGSRTLAARGIATLWFIVPSECIVSGAGVT